MLERLVTAVRGRHFWRRASFSEISALYIAKVLRLLALNLVSLFILVMLYQAGYSLQYIIIYSAFYALLCTLASPLAAVLTARFGAKLILLISNLLFIPTMFLLSQIQADNDFAITFGAVFQSLASTLYQVAHDVIFSEIKSCDNAGKEIGYMAVFEKVTVIVSPLVGGLVSGLWGPKVALGLASVLFVVSTWPLFRAQGVAKKSHFFSLASFPFRAYWRELVFQICLGFNWLVARIWPLFLIIVIFPFGNPFAIIGIFTSFSAVVSAFMAFVIGKLIDKSSLLGRQVFIGSSLGEAICILWRAIIRTPLQAGVNLLCYDSMSVVQNIATLRAQFDSADRSGSRVVYVMLRHLAWNFFSFGACLILWLCFACQNQPVAGMQIFFIIASGVSALYCLSGYRLYRKT